MFTSDNAQMCIWGVFSSHRRSPFELLSVNFNQFNIEILYQYILPFENTNHTANLIFIFQPDRCGLHRNKRVAEYLSASDVNVLTWLAQSPDPNPIEIVYGITKRCMCISPKSTNTSNE